ncbi:hypothetical protein H4582DRAFT_1933815 [Lactarius indigo]|nr:hypothetical protein H4582DRAFT_1933815 [Lactarius indigo]
MSRSATVSTSKNPPQLPSKSAWARGPPQNSATTTPSRSQSPAPPTPVSLTNPASFHATHSRRSSALGQGVSIKDGVNIPRSAVKQGSAVTFGSIDDASAPISSSPASAPAVKPADGVKSFGSVAVQNGVSDAAKSAVTNRPPPLSSATSTSSSHPAPPSASTPSPVPKFDKKSIAKLFQGPSTQSVPTPPHEAASPASRSTSLPSQHNQGQPYPPNFASGPLRQGQNGNPSAPPRSPVYTRPMANGQNGGVGVSGGRPQAGSGGTSAGPAPAAMPSPRLTPHAPPGPPSGLPPPPTMWQGYYYHPQFVPGVPPDQFYPPQWSGHLIPPQHQPPPPHHPPGAGPPSAPLPMSPRNPPLSLQQVPGTPTQSHALPPIHHPPHPSAPHPPPSVTSPPPTPSTANRPTSLSANAGAFVPGKKISIKHPSGQEVNLDTLKRAPPPAVPIVPAVPPSPAPVKKDIKRPIRIESQEQKEKRLAEEKAREGESEEKNKASETFAKVNEDAARLERELRKAEERRLKEEAERAEKERKEAEERAAREERERKEAEERAAREEEERKEAEERAAREAREVEEREKERLRLEEARAQREAEEKAQRERAEQERLRKLKEEEEAKEAAEQRRIAEEEALKAAEAAEAIRALADATSDAKPDSLPEEGEIEDEVSQPTTAEEALPSKTAPTSSPAPVPADLSAKEPLRIDTSLPSPEHQRRRPGPLNLQTAISSNIPPALPSALATARHIEDINRIIYPEGIKSPKIELNVNTQKGKFRYDRDFLLQFMNICKEKPDHLPPLDVIGLEPSDTAHTMSRGGSGRSRASNSMSMPGSVRSTSIGLGFLPGTMGKSAGNGFQMGQFSTSANKMSSEERFAASGVRSASVSGPLGGRPPAMVRTISQGGTNTRDRTRSKRGGTDSNRSGVMSNTGPSSLMSNMGPPMEPFTPLEVSANRWVAGSTRRGGSGPDSESPEVVERKVKALLNKLTMERFDSISDQIIAWANKSEKEKDGRTLIQVIKLVFEKATDEATFSEMYARLCRKMMEQISPKVQDDGIKNSEGKPFAGGNLFRKYLLNRCQEDFERGWVAKEATALAAANKASADKAVKEANDKTKGGEESELYSEEYYAAAKAKRRGLGLIRFIGELFKLQMLTERIMHECIKKLLGNVENPEEEEIESLCKLLITVGSLLDTPKARAHLDVYFSRMRELTKNKNVNARMVFMLQDVIELRERKWVPRNAVAAPTTIAQVHEAAAKEKLAHEKDAFLRQNNTSMSRGGSRRGGNREVVDVPHPDGWSVAGAGAARVQPKAGDLSQFGKITKPTQMSFAPTSVFNNKKGDSKSRDSPMSRTASSSNMFSMLQSSDVTVDPPTSKSSRPPSRKPSVDLGVGGPPEPPQQRRKLQLLPRTKPVGEESKPSTPAASETGSDDEATGEDGTPAPAAISEGEAKAKIDEDIKEFFGIRMLDEGESYFSNLPTEHRHRLVDALVMKSIEMKDPDVVLVGDLFARVREKDLCSPAMFEEGFNALAEILDDLAVDIPKAWSYFATLLKGSGLDQDEERYARIAEKTMDSDRLNQLL